jgi:hypothetical protein
VDAGPVLTHTNEMKYILALILLPVMAMAETETKVSEPAKPSKKVSLYELVIGQNSEDVQTGKSFFIRILQNDPTAFEKSFYEQLKSDITDELLSRGYEKAKDKKDANMLIDLEMYKNKFVSNDKDQRYKIERSTDSKEIKIELAPGDNLIQIDAIGWAQDYMARKRPIFHLHVKSADRFLETGFPTNNELKYAFSKMILNPPKQNKKMAGPPGCMPKFGYDLDFANNLGEDKKLRVWRVPASSAAGHAGIRKGDQILAIDDLSYTEGWTSEKQQSLDEIITQQKAVPIKIKRGQKELALKIKAEKDCVN